MRNGRVGARCFSFLATFAFRRLVGEHPRGAELAPHLQEPLELEAGKTKRENPFTGDSYRALHSVVDLPVRVDDILPDGPPKDGEDLGRIVFSMVGFQVMDEETARKNEHGPASHRRYKKRQAVTALRRLSRGLVVPRKRRRTGEGRAPSGGRGRRDGRG